MIAIKSIEPIENPIKPIAFTLKITVKLLDEISDYIQFYIIKSFGEEGFSTTQTIENMQENFLVNFLKYPG